MKVLVIGGAGYLGSHVVRKLLNNNHQVRVLDKMDFSSFSLDNISDNENLEIVEGDMRNISTVYQCLNDMEAVIILAAVVGEPACDASPEETVQTNFLAVKAIADCSIYLGIKRFIFASTDSVYGIQEGTMTEKSKLNPISLYAQTKVWSEKAILGMKNKNFNPTIIRMATLYGYSPRMRFDLVINVLTKNAVLNNKIMIYGGEQWRPLVHVSDAAKAYVMCIESPVEKVSNQIFDVGSNDQNYKIKQLGLFVKEVMPDLEIEKIEMPPDLRNYFVSFDKISEELGFSVDYSVKDGITEIIKAFNDGKFPDPDLRKYYNA